MDVDATSHAPDETQAASQDTASDNMGGSEHEDAELMDDDVGRDEDNIMEAGSEAKELDGEPIDESDAENDGMEEEVESSHMDEVPDEANEENELPDLDGGDNTVNTNHDEEDLESAEANEELRENDEGPIDNYSSHSAGSQEGADQEGEELEAEDAIIDNEPRNIDITSDPSLLANLSVGRGDPDTSSHENNADATEITVIKSAGIETKHESPIEEFKQDKLDNAREGGHVSTDIKEQNNPAPIQNDVAPQETISMNPSLSIDQLTALMQNEVESIGFANLRLLLREAQEERDHLTRINSQLNLKVLGLWDEFGQPMASMPFESVGTKTDNEIKNMYRLELGAVSDLYNTFRKKQDSFSARIDKLNARLDEEDEIAGELTDSLRDFKREIAKAAIFDRTGKPIPLRKIYHLEQLEDEIDKELEVLRLKYIHFRNQLSKLDAQVREREKLSDGLHLIDFEQLKIENQTLNEKIEERNDELHKLRKKITTTVQVLTHIKEKLHFVDKDNSKLEEELSTFNSKVSALRDQLTKAKRVRDKLRKDNSHLKQKLGFVGSNMLVVDFERRKLNMVTHRERLNELKGRHTSLTQVIKEGRQWKQSISET